MPNITVRNIPESVMNKIRTLSRLDKRSINNEILLILEQGLELEEGEKHKSSAKISLHTQLEIWKELSGQWDDIRPTDEIIDDIISRRTAGREVAL